MLFWKTTQEWEGQTVAVLGGGPSMTRLVAAAVRASGVRSIAVNNQGIRCRCAGILVQAMAPWADILYAADNMWWYNNRIEAKAFKGRRATIQPNGKHSFTPCVEGTLVLGNGGPNGFDDRPDYLRTGWNSGYQAIHLAAHLGAKRIVLCGFDMHARRGQHWHEDHAWRPGYKSRYELFRGAFDGGAHEFRDRGVEVVCCSPGSALTGTFEVMTIEEALHGLRGLREGEESLPRASAQGARGDREGQGRGAGEAQGTRAAGEL